jgi:hypothetical protein
MIFWQFRQPGEIPFMSLFGLINRSKGRSGTYHVVLDVGDRVIQHIRLQEHDTLQLFLYRPPGARRDACHLFCK